jgi:hypothetical protein
MANETGGVQKGSKMTSSVEDVRGRLADKYAADFAAAAKSDDAGSALSSLMAKINTEATDIARSERDAAKAEAEKYAQAHEDFEIEAKAALDPVLATLVDAFANLPEARTFTVRLGKDDDGKPTAPTILVGTKTGATRRASNGAVGGRAASITVDGTEYKSAAEAKRTLLADKAEASMNRGAIVSALESAGHTVS